MKLLQALKNVSKGINKEFEDSKLLEHSGEKGQFREEIIQTFLRPYLPECFGIGTGEVFSSSGETSNQIDIVIYDAIFSNVLFKNKKTSIFPCESVYGEIEIKSNLSIAELELSIVNINSLKKLEREESKMNNITPICEIGLGNGLTCDQDIRNPYLGIVFGYDGALGENVVKYLNERLLKESDILMLPDFIFNLKKGYMIFRANGSKTASFASNYDKFTILNTGENTIMFLTLNSILNSIRLKSPNYNQYWIDLYNETLVNIAKEYATSNPSQTNI
jgi:hypothetical protein